MSDEGFREVQLTGKKLVFLSMVGALVLVVVFLLGVMVGRGVRGPGPTETSSAEAAVQAATEPGVVPPPTKASDVGIDYNALVGGTDPKKAIEPPATPPDAAETPAAPPAAAADAPNAAAAAAAKAVPKADAPKPAPAAKPDQPKPDASKPDITKTNAAAKTDAAAKPAAPSTGQWLVQVGAYSKQAAADGVVASLKKKNFDAFVSHGGPLYLVQLGPFTDKADADRIRLALQKEGFKPSIKR